MTVDDSLDPAELERILIGELALPPRQPWYAAFSGGLDSTVLLHGLLQLRDRIGLDLRALHAHHGLHGQADAWLEHCVAICKHWDIDLVHRRLDLAVCGGRNMEERAREARYGWFREVMAPGSVLLTAHHQGDQAETLLANLLRGAGVHGLAAISSRAVFGDGIIVRPLLAFPRPLLRQYAQHHRLQWVEDSSNQDLGINRNYIRHAVLPVFAERWPGVFRTLARTARHMRHTAELLDAVAEQDLQGVPREDSLWGQRLDVEALARLSEIRQRNALRYWFRASGHRAPTARQLSLLWQQMVARRPTSTAVLRWPESEVRRYRRWLYLSAPIPEFAPAPLRWCWRDPLALPALGLLLRAVPAIGDGIAVSRLPDCLTVEWRHGGECLRLPGREHRQKLKKLLQSAGVPPWYRDRIPLLYIDDQIAAFTGRWYSEPFAANVGEDGVVFELRKAGADADSLP